MRRPSKNHFVIAKLHQKSKSANNMLRFGIVFACLLALSAADQYPLCADTSNTGTLNNVVVIGCSPSARCTVRKGSSLSLAIDFTPSRGSTTLYVGLFGVLPGLPLPLPFLGFDTNGCNAAYHIQCPLTADTLYQYNNTIVVPTAVLTPLNVQAKVQLKDDITNTITCFLVDLRIES